MEGGGGVGALQIVCAALGATSEAGSEMRP